MDDVHKPDDRPFISEEVDLGQWLHESQALVEHWAYGEIDQETSSVSADSALADICSRMGMEEDEGLGMAARTDPARLLCGEELDEENPFTTEPPPSDSPLRTLEIQAEEVRSIFEVHMDSSLTRLIFEVRRKEERLSYRQEAANRLKYRRLNFRLQATHCAASPYGQEMRLLHQPEDLVLTLAFCSPYNKPLEQHKIRLGRLLRLDTILLARGRTLLTDLRDRISCPSDYGTSEDVSDDPANQLNKFSSAKEAYPSGCFFINNTFFDDMRHPDAHPLSQTVLEWAKSNRKGIDKRGLGTREMSGVALGDLSVRFGQPQLYLHQGSCEHLWMVTSARLMGPDDAQELEAYPFPISRKAKSRVSCMVSAFILLEAYPFPISRKAKSRVSCMVSAFILLEPYPFPISRKAKSRVSCMVSALILLEAYPFPISRKAKSCVYCMVSALILLEAYPFPISRKAKSRVSCMVSALILLEAYPFPISRKAKSRVSCMVSAFILLEPYPFPISRKAKSRVSCMVSALILLEAYPFPISRKAKSRVSCMVSAFILLEPYPFPISRKAKSRVSCMVSALILLEAYPFPISRKAKSRVSCMVSAFILLEPYPFPISRKAKSRVSCMVSALILLEAYPFPISRKAKSCVYCMVSALILLEAYPFPISRKAKSRVSCMVSALILLEAYPFPISRKAKSRVSCMVSAFILLEPYPFPISRKAKSRVSCMVSALILLEAYPFPISRKAKSCVYCMVSALILLEAYPFPISRKAKSRVSCMVSALILLEAYPFPISRKAKSRVSCMACKHYIAKFVVSGSERGPVDPQFLCLQCLQTFHYDQDGNKTGDFSVANFFDKSALVN